VADWLRPGNPEWAEMAARARAISKPHATNDIVEAVLNLIE
jgi:UDP-N-acetylglucosamine:LPS N-acetylglucosamine transferase